MASLKVKIFTNIKSRDLSGVFIETRFIRPKSIQDVLFKKYINDITTLLIVIESFPNIYPTPYNQVINSLLKNKPIINIF